MQACGKKEKEKIPDSFLDHLKTAQATFPSPGRRKGDARERCGRVRRGGGGGGQGGSSGGSKQEESKEKKWEEYIKKRRKI